MSRPTQLTNAKPIFIDHITHIKWGLFRLIEWLGDLSRNKTAHKHPEFYQPDRPMDSLWVFVSTIGELNAIDPLLREIVVRLPFLKLVLITDHALYRNNYSIRYPTAEIFVTHGHSSDAILLARHYPPKLLIIAEIPCWPSDAPCRFSYSFLLQAKKSGARIVLVNGWLYYYATASRLDAIERKLFMRDYLCAFDAIGVQTEQVRQQLLAAGAIPERVAVNGNIKFDATYLPDWSPTKARSPTMLTALIESARPIIVTGCVTNLTEQEAVLNAFVIVRKHHPDALLVLAPRHPEVSERMQTLRNFLDHRNLPAIFRSSLDDVPITSTSACLVLDTIGDLRDFYAAATVAYVGLNHNVLEPLAFGKPVTVMPGWETTYPSYPVYKTLLDSKALLEADNAEQLSNYWQQLLNCPDLYHKRMIDINNSLASLRGAVKNHIAQIEPLLLTIQSTQYQERL